MNYDKCTCHLMTAIDPRTGWAIMCPYCDNLFSQENNKPEYLPDNGERLY